MKKTKRVKAWVFLFGDNGKEGAAADTNKNILLERYPHMKNIRNIQRGYITYTVNEVRKK